jgi:hypothetical protein
LHYYLQRQREAELEQAHRRGYADYPEAAVEFDVWDRMQAWPEK